MSNICGLHHRASKIGQIDIVVRIFDRLSNSNLDRLRDVTLRTDTHNLISKPHSVPPYTPYTTELVVAGSNLRTSLRSYVNYGTDRSGSKQYRTISAVRSVKSFRSDAGGLASLGRRGLSVRHRRTRFARPPIGVRRDRLSDGRTDGLTYLRTQSKAYRNDQL